MKAEGNRIGTEGVTLGFESELNLPDPDPVATQEWIDSILAVRNQLGDKEARRILLATVNAARESGVDIDLVNTPYVNSISVSNQGNYPGDLVLEKRLHEVIRWNAMMMVTRATNTLTVLGGTSQPMLQHRTHGRSVSIISSAVKTATGLVTTYIGKATHHQESMLELG